MREPGTVQRRGGSLGPEALFRIIGSRRGPIRELPGSSRVARRPPGALNRVRKTLVNAGRPGRIYGSERWVRDHRLGQSPRWRLGHVAAQSYALVASAAAWIRGWRPLRHLFHRFHAQQNVASLGFALPRHANAPPKEKTPALLILVHSEERYSGFLQQTFRQGNSNRIFQPGLDQDVEVAFA